FQVPYPIADYIPLQRLFVDNLDLLDTCCCGRVAAAVQFLYEPFARTQSRKLDVDVLIRHEPGKPDHIFSEFNDSNGFAHIEHEYFRTLCKGRSLNNKRNGFRDCHEVATRVRVRHSYRSPGGNLGLKNRHDASAATKDIAKADGHALGTWIRLRCADDSLAHTLRRTHHADRVHGFIGRDHDQAAQIMFTPNQCEI